MRKSSQGRHGLATVPLPLSLGVGQPSVGVASLGPQWQSIDPGIVSSGGKVGTWLAGVFTAAGSALHNSRRKQQGRRQRGRREAGQGEYVAPLVDPDAGFNTDPEDERDFQLRQQHFHERHQEFFQQQGQLQFQQQHQQQQLQNQQQYPQPQQYQQQQQQPPHQPQQQMRQQQQQQHHQQQQLQQQQLQQQQQQQQQQPCISNENSGNLMMVPVQQPVEALAQSAFMAPGGQVWVPVGWMPAQQSWCTSDGSESTHSGMMAMSMQQLPSMNGNVHNVAHHQQQQQQQQQHQHQHQSAVPSLQMPVVWQQNGASSSSSAQLNMGSWESSMPSTPHSSSVSQTSSMQSPSLMVASKARCSAREADVMVMQLRSKDMALKRAVLEQIVSGAWSLALTRHGCRVVQAAVDAADTSCRIALADSLKGHVLEAVRSPHANHVLQKCVAMLPPDHVRFVLTEIQGHVRDSAKHPFGCRVLERLLEHCPYWMTQGLAMELLGDVVDLARHPYGNYVVQHLLEHGQAQHRRAIAQILTPQISRLARHKIASNVVEKAWLYCDDEERQAMREMMTGSPEELASLEHSNYGSFVVKEMRRR
eukprot:CAMPEP_0203929156 /NCGR_PEP_ID=MMETSP0359-20131031/68104_1 /ASSEMBLY_ACC=CAM_ASM_000338 /TAXON_ID=268821 /ORGANISM="Scrippsiella Hangoei, Strain SHTV-5" /LENGTH=589 /DNA_ID=CAMNT_0050858141 /DNA_START=189 /DNA_END=1958 /DNA_ORIENTATION=-